MRRSGGVLWVLLIGGGCIVFNSMRYPTVGDALSERPFSVEGRRDPPDAQAEAWRQLGPAGWIDQYALLNPNAEFDRFRRPPAVEEDDLYRVVAQLDSALDANKWIAPPRIEPSPAPREEVALMSTGKNWATPIVDPERSKLDIPIVRESSVAASPEIRGPRDDIAGGGEVDGFGGVGLEDRFVESPVGRAYRTLYPPDSGNETLQPHSGSDMGPRSPTPVDVASPEWPSERPTGSTPTTPRTNEPVGESPPTPDNENRSRRQPSQASFTPEDVPIPSQPREFPRNQDMIPVPPREAWEANAADRLVTRPTQAMNHGPVGHFTSTGSEEPTHRVAGHWTRDLPPIQDVDDQPRSPSFLPSAIVPIYPSTGVVAPAGW